MIDVLIKIGTGWNVKLIESQYINTFTYKSLSKSFYINLPVELRSPRKGVINIEKKGQKCFLWCDVRHINLSKKHLEKIKRRIKKLLKNLTMMELRFQCKKKILTRLK